MDNTPCKQECHNCKDFMYFGDGSSGMGKCVFDRDTTTRQYITTYSCQNPECRQIHHNPDKCPSCGCTDNDTYELPS
jgi:hypothetical protein